MPSTILLADSSTVLVSKLCATRALHTLWVFATINSVKFRAKAHHHNYYQDQNSAQGGWAYTPNFIVHRTLSTVLHKENDSFP